MKSFGLAIVLFLGFLSIWGQFYYFGHVLSVSFYLNHRLDIEEAANFEKYFSWPFAFFYGALTLWVFFETKKTETQKDLRSLS